MPMTMQDTGWRGFISTAMITAHCRDGRSVNLLHALTEERQAIWWRSSEGSANFRTPAPSRRC